MHTEGTSRQAILKRAAAVRLAIFDVDGVLSDGRLYFSDDGREFKAFHAQDGFGLKRLQANGITVAVISARSSQIVTRRMAELGIADVYQGHTDKYATFQSLIQAHGLSADEVAYAGDDLLDLPVMACVGLSCSVADGHPLVVSRAHFVTARSGGAGAVREICDLILEAQGLTAGELAGILGDRK